MALASTSRVQLRYIKESVFGTTPGAGNGRNLRMTGESFNYDLTKEMSKEIRSDRQNGSTTTVDAEASGGFNFHMQYAEYDELIEGVMQGAWTVYGTNGVTGTAFSGTVASGTITAAVAPTGADAFTNLQKGQWFQYQLTGDPNDKVWFKVSEVTAPTTTVITLDASTPGTAAGPTAGAKIATSRLVNATTQSSYSFEKEFADVTQFFRFTGMTPNKMSLNFAAAALTDGSFEFMGKQGFRAAVTGLPGTPVESKAYDIQNGVRGVGHLWEGGAPITGTYIKSLGMNLDNSLRHQKAINNLGSVGIGSGDFMVTGSMEVYFANGTMYDKFLADTYTKITVGCQDTDGNGYVFQMPRVMLTSGRVVAGGKNQDAMLSFDYQAYADLGNATAALRKTLFIDRLGVAVT